MEKKKKNIILLSIIIAVLIVLVICLVVMFISKNYVGKFKVDYNLDDRVQELFQNDYSYYYFMYGNVQTGEGYITVDGENYYIVNDKNIISLARFYEIVNDSYISSMVNTLLDVEDCNEYIEVDNIIYVKKRENPCVEISQFDLSSLSYSYSVEKVRVVFDRRPTTIYNEDGKWKLGGNVYYCVTETGDAEIEEAVE